MMEMISGFGNRLQKMQADVLRYVPLAFFNDHIAPALMHGATLEFVDLNAERLEVVVWDRVKSGARCVSVFGARGCELRKQTRNCRLQFEAGGQGWKLAISTPTHLVWHRGEEDADVRFHTSAPPIRGLDADVILYAIRREGTSMPPPPPIPRWRSDATAKRLRAMMEGSPEKG